MAALPRFYIAPVRWNLEDLKLEGDEAKHCTGVMRRGVGDEIVVFNGTGSRARARIERVSGREAALTVLEAVDAASPAVTLELVQAIPKGGNMDWIVEKAVELGVNVIQPVMTDRTVVKLDVREAAKKQEKWQRAALEACKQCGQDWLPEIRTPRRLSEVFAPGGLPPHDLRIIAAIQEDAVSFKEILARREEAGAGAPESVLLCIGPEGDFAEHEYALAREQGCLPMTLGPIILRVETAAMYGLSVLGYELRSLGPGHT
jgi:16S rRNA (uracil1498-N3)-methyltransferase